MTKSFPAHDEDFVREHGSGRKLATH